MGKVRHLPQITRRNKMAETKENKTKSNDTRVVILPLLDYPNAPTEEFYSLNFKNYLIRRGEPVEVPVEIYNLIMESEKASNDAKRYANSIPVKEA